MWIEQRKLLFGPHQVSAKGKGAILTAGGLKLELSQAQHQYYDSLIHGHSIHQTVKTFLAKGWLVSFREMWHLIKALAENRIIMNPEIHSYFALANLSINASGISDLSTYKGQVAASPENLKSLPFFRGLPPELQKLFVQNTSVKTVPQHTRICKTGDLTRELFTLIDGMAGVYKTFPDNHRQLLSTVPKGGTFGEGGFLLGKPRAADVITLEKSTVLVVQYDPEFNKMIDAGKAEALQRRFWVLHGLLSSDLFSHIPTETLDSLVFAGKIQNIKEGTVITREGDLGSSFYIILQGSVAFTQQGKSLRALSQGGIFGEIALMVSGGKRTATAQAQRDCIVMEIQMQEFYELLSNHLILAKEVEEVAWKRWDARVK
jgi:CRP-like cAMP-binding protein